MRQRDRERTQSNGPPSSEFTDQYSDKGGEAGARENGRGEPG